eukprot:COSAG05_NODE_232_length_13313_cov_677.565991_4_plen_657_part_00
MASRFCLIRAWRSVGRCAATAPVAAAAAAGLVAAEMRVAPHALLLLLLLLLLLPTAAESKGKGSKQARRKKKRLAVKEADLTCSACEVLVTDVQNRLRGGRRDDAAIVEAMEGVCMGLEYFAITQEYPRSFIKASGHDPESAQSEPDAVPAGEGGAVKVVRAKAMHDRLADRRLQELCDSHLDKFEDDLVRALRLGSPSQSVASEVCYANVKECAIRDAEGGQLICPVLSRRRDFDAFLVSARKNKGAGLVGFTGGDDDLRALVLQAATRHCVPACRLKFALVQDATLASSLGHASPSLVLFRGSDGENATIQAGEASAIQQALQRMGYAGAEEEPVENLLRWTHMHVAPQLGRLMDFEGLVMDEHWGTGSIPSQVIMFDDWSEPDAHAERLQTFAGALKAFEDKRNSSGLRRIVPGLVDVGRRTRKQYEADIMQRYGVKSKRATAGPVLRAFTRDLKSQTFGTRLGGLVAEGKGVADFTIPAIVEYLEALGRGEVPALSPLSEFVPSAERGDMELMPGLRRVVGKTFNELVFGAGLFFLSTFGSPCPDCQWSQPPFAAAAQRYGHMPADVVGFGAMNTAKNEVNGISNAMPSQLWAFGPNGDRQPRRCAAVALYHRHHACSDDEVLTLLVWSAWLGRYDAANGYNHEQVLAWVQR